GTAGLRGEVHRSRAEREGQGGDPSLRQGRRGRPVERPQVPATHPGVREAGRWLQGREGPVPEEPREVDRGGVADQGGRRQRPRGRRDQALPPEEGLGK
ncbi:hypothetical protein AVDCRST_MAG82-3599, partial [uncultured Rubrobacteraceae bacterium]